MRRHPRPLSKHDTPRGSPVWEWVPRLLGWGLFIGYILFWVKWGHALW